MTAGGGSWGDPHVFSFDGQTYDFPATVDVLLTRALDSDLNSDLEIQVRQGPWRLHPETTLNLGLATSLAGHDVCFDVSHSISPEFTTCRLQPDGSGCPQLSCLQRRPLQRHPAARLWIRQLSESSVDTESAGGWVLANPCRLPLQIFLESQSKKIIPMSKAQLTAFLAKVETNPALKLQVDAAADASAVVAIAQAEGFAFSPASLERHLRG